MADWDLEAIAAKWQARWWRDKIHQAERPPAPPGSGARVAAAAEPAAKAPARAGAQAPARGAKSTFFIHFAYPGISGYLHVGHMRGFTYTDVFARVARQSGKNVLFPAGFHASGIPAVAFAKEVARGEKTEYLRANGYDGPLERLADPRQVVDYFAHVYTHDYWKRFGFLIDERRNCTTIDAGYQRFIQWQFRRLNDLGHLVQKPHYAPFCPVAGPVAVDKSETDIKQGGAAEVLEFLALRFVLRGDLAGHKDVVVPCATLRPETVYGATNVWIHPEAHYHLVRVWQDGAVGDRDATQVWLVSEQGRRKLEWQFERAEAMDAPSVRGADLVGRQVTAPLTGKAVPIVAGAFVDPQTATGIVMSVPAHAPFDWAAYQDAGLAETLGEPPQIVAVEGYRDLPAREACRQHKVRSAADREALEAATQQVYADEFNKGVLTDACGPYAGKRIKAVKEPLRAELVQQGHARILRQFSETVISRAGERVEIKRIPDQAFIHYADAAWTQRAKDHAKAMAVYPERYKEELPSVLDWFGDRACVRRGAWLGTEYPFKPGWIVEPIADSTFYPWYYLVSLYVNDGRLRAEDLSDAFFDYVFNGRGAGADGSPPREAGAKAAVWESVRADAKYWGPVDVNLGGKEHQTVHFPVYIMNQVALLDDAEAWPRGIFVNWWVTQKAGAKISKSKGGAEPIPGAAKKYGVDPMRLYYCHVGSPHVDIEWDPDIVLTYRNHVLRLGRQADELLSAGGAPGPMDAWLEAAVAAHLRAAHAAYEAYDLRTAATELVYGLPETLRWYARRGGGNAGLLRDTVRAWAVALCPMLPHVAEEMHERAGGRGLASLARLPRPEAGDDAAIARESYVRDVLEDIQTVRKLAGAGTTLRLFSAPSWKVQLMREALRLAPAGGAFPMAQFMKAVMADPAMRERGMAVQQFAGKVAAQVQRLAPHQRAALSGDANETQWLREAAAFLAQETGLRVQVHDPDEPGAPDHPKRDVASPLKPGIAIDA